MDRRAVSIADTAQVPQRRPDGVAVMPADGLGWVLFGAGTAAVVSVSRRLDAAFLLHSGFDFLWQVPAIPFTVGAIAGLAAPQPPGRRYPPVTRPLTVTQPLNERGKRNAASHEG